MEKIDDHTILVRAGSPQGQARSPQHHRAVAPAQALLQDGPELGEAVQLGRGTHHGPFYVMSDVKKGSP